MLLLTVVPEIVRALRETGNTDSSQGFKYPLSSLCLSLIVLLTEGAVIKCIRSVSNRERRSRSPRERDPLERSSRSRQQRSRSREHEYHDRGERHMEYVRERSHEREPAMVRERSRERSRERDPYERSSREYGDRGRNSSDTRRYESDRHRVSEREYSSSRTSRH